MRVAVCVEQVPDARGPLSLREETASLDQEGLVPIANPADLNALALIRQVLPAGAAEVTAISVGPATAEGILRKCLAAGADQALRIWDVALESSDVHVISRVLAGAVSALGFDIILCGACGMGSGSGYVGSAIAEHLGIPQVCSVTHLEVSPQDGFLIAHRKLDRGDREVVRCSLPAVLTVEDGVAEVPYASLPALLKAERTEIPVMDLASLGLGASDMKSTAGARVLGYIPPRPRTKKTPAPDTALPPAERMRQMMAGGASQKKGELLEGEPRQVAEAIIRFLKSHAILTE